MPARLAARLPATALPQFLGGLRGARPKLHRATGLAYLGGVFLGGVPSLGGGVRVLANGGILLWPLNLVFAEWLSRSPRGPQSSPCRPSIRGVLAHRR